MHISYHSLQVEYFLQENAFNKSTSEKTIVVITNILKFLKQCIAAEMKAQKILRYKKRQIGYRNK